MMDSNNTQRKLTTILAADVVSYSKMMGEDEEGTFRTLQRYRKVFEDYVSRHEGRIFNTAGDAILAEFGSSVQAVRCAIAIQETLHNYNQDPNQDPKMQFRIGLNVGDVIADGNDLFGDGVNIAARMESCAEPGGICMSGSVHEIVANKLSFAFIDMGPQNVKNIAKPVPAFGLHPTGEISVKAPSKEKSTATTTTGNPNASPRSWKWLLIVIAIIVILALTYMFRSNISKLLSSSDGQTQIQLTESELRGRSAKGIRLRNGEPFIMTFNELGDITMRVTTEDGLKTRTDGKWWVNKYGALCLTFPWLKQGDQICRGAVQEGDRTLLISNISTLPVWIMINRE